MDSGSASSFGLDDRHGPGEGALPRLREDIVSVALGRATPVALGAFDDFLAEDATPEALAAWYDERYPALSSGGRDALRSALDRDIAALDQLIGEQVEAILHHHDFQALEAAWRGIAYLLDAAEEDEKVKVRLLSVTWDELCRDFEKATEFDQSRLFDKIYNEEFGTPGGLPYGLILCDYAVQHRRHSGRPGSRVDDISGLMTLSSIGAAAFVPCIVGADPALLGVESFADLSHTVDVQALFRGAEYGRWHGFQERADSRFLGIVLPRMLLRRPWDDSGARRDRFRFCEGSFGLASENWLWGNGVYAFGAVVVRAFRQSGWFADIRGTRPDAEEAGIVTGLPAPAFSTREAVAYRRPIEVELADKKQKALEEMGFVTLSPCHMTEDIAFLGTQSVYREALSGGEAFQANSRLSAMLQYVLCVSRFAHYVKVIARDRVGAYTTADELQALLTEWLQQYMLGNTDASNEMKARYPLHGGSVEVAGVPGKPGTFGCTMYLQPHFQIDHMVAAFRLYTEMQGLRVT